MMPPFYSVCYSAVYCAVTLVLLSMDSYEAATTDNGLKNQSYICLASIFAIGRVSLLKDQPSAKNSPATATRLMKC